MLGIPLNGPGFFYFSTFNTLCLLSLWSHQKAAWTDPGVIPARKVTIQINVLICNRNLLEHKRWQEYVFARNAIIIGNLREHITAVNANYAFLRYFIDFQFEIDGSSLSMDKQLCWR